MNELYNMNYYNTQKRQNLYFPSLVRQSYSYISVTGVIICISIKYFIFLSEDL